MESTEVKMVGLTRSTCGLSEAQVQLVMALGEEKVCVGHYSTCFLFPCVAKLPCKKLVSVFFFLLHLQKLHSWWTPVPLLNPTLTLHALDVLFLVVWERWLVLETCFKLYGCRMVVSASVGVFSRAHSTEILVEWTMLIRMMFSNNVQS